MVGASFSGAQYFTKAIPLITKPGIRGFVFIPLLVNFMLLSLASYWLVGQVSGWRESIEQNSWEWVQAIFDSLGWLIWPVVYITLIIAIFYFFAIVANWIAAPFNGLLAEAVEKHISGGASSATGSVSLIKDLPRMFGREWHKFKYWLPKALACLILFFIPVVNAAAPVIWILFSAWMLAIQYVDYPMDNHRISFQTMLAELRSRRSGSMGFGGVVLLFTFIPVANLLVMPVAVVGATLLWHEQIKPKI